MKIKKGMVKYMDKTSDCSKKPYAVELKAGEKYLFCAGKSDKQPFCDLQSHKGFWNYLPKTF